MKKHGYWTLAALALAFVAACTGGRNKQGNGAETDSLATANMVEDTTEYGTCGEGTAMHTLELLTGKGDTLVFNYDVDGSVVSDIQGGLEVGDSLAVIDTQTSDGRTVVRAINLTTLLGKWTSLERNLEFLKNGRLISTLKEPHTYTHWTICNGHLVLSADTFDIENLGPDSLSLKNRQGIWKLKRQR